MNEDLLKALEDDIQRNRLILPSLPDVALRVRQVLEQPDCSMHDLARVISTDASVAARLIKIANSVTYRGNRPIEDIRSAIARLGMQMVRTLVNQLALLSAMHGYGGRLGQHLALITHHSLTIGATCHVLANRYTRLNPEEALLAGLVHDIGMLPLLARIYAAHDAPADIPTIEALLHPLHTRVGGMVLRAWQFKPELIAVAEQHEDQQRRPYSAGDLVDVVIAANLYQHLRESGEPGILPADQHAPAFQKLGITAEKLLSDQTVTDQITSLLEHLGIP